MLPADGPERERLLEVVQGRLDGWMSKHESTVIAEGIYDALREAANSSRENLASTPVDASRVGEGPTVTDEGLRHEYSLLDAVLPAGGDRRTAQVHMVVKLLVAAHARQPSLLAARILDSLRAAAAPARDTETPAMRLARWLDGGPDRIVQIIVETDGAFRVSLWLGVTCKLRASKVRPSRDEAITAALDAAAPSSPTDGPTTDSPEEGR